MKAFWQLYCEKDIHRITVAELCERAGYNRREALDLCKDPILKMVTDVYSHIMNYDRKRLARKVNDEFFLSKKETAPEQQSANEGMTQLIQMLNASPDLVGPLLQMTQIMGTKLN